MNLQIIGVIKDSGGNNIGYRIFDTDRKVYKDVPIENIKKVLNEGRVQIKGIGVKHGKIVGTNGSIDRYPTIINGNIYGKSPLVIVEQLMGGDTVIGYTVVDWKGKMLKATLDDVIKYAKHHGISNGAVKNLGHKDIISSIYGEYDKVAITNTKMAEDDIETSIWTMDDFERYMRDNGFEYSKRKNPIYNTMEIRFECSEIKVMKLPKEIKVIGNYLVKGTSSAEVLIVPPSVEHIGINPFQDAPMLRRVVFQEGMKHLDLGSRYWIEGKADELEVVFPSTLEHLQGAIYGANNIVEIKLGHTKLEKCVESFVNLIGLTKVQLPSTLKEIEGSFRNCKALEELDIPESIELIGKGSFEGVGIRELDLSKCKNLKTIDNRAFSECRDLERVILPEGLTSIESGAFSLCPKLEEVIFPESLMYIGSGAFEDCNITEFKVNRNLKSLGRNVFTSQLVVKFDGSNSHVKSYLLKGNRYKRIELNDSILAIGIAAFHSMEIKDTLEMPKNLTTIGEDAFRSSDIRLDLRNCKDLKSIGDSAFGWSKITEAILPEGLERIGNYCFKNCANLQHVLIPRSIKKIGKYAFRGVGASVNTGTMFYVYDKSHGLRYCSRNKLKYAVIDSIEDLEKYTVTERELDEREKAKFRLVLSADKRHQELLQPEFIDYADVIHRMYSYINSELVDGQRGLELDTSKFVDVPMSKISILNKARESRHKVLSEIPAELIEKYNENNLSNRFIVLSNFITKTLNINPGPFTEGGIRFIRNSDGLDYGVVYTDRYASIFKLVVLNRDYIPSLTNVIVITMGDSVKFVSVLDSDINVPFQNILSNNNITEKLTGSIAEWLEPGDSFTASTRWSYVPEHNRAKRAPLPAYVKEEVVKSFAKSCKIIAYDKRGVEDIRKTVNTVVDYLCLNSGKVITTQSNLYAGRIGHLSSLRDVKDITVLEVRDLNNISEETMQRIEESTENEKSNSLYMYKSNEQKYTEYFQRMEGAYDEESALEWEVGQILGSYSVREIRDIPDPIFSVIFDTAFFRKTTRKLENIRRLGPVVNTVNIGSDRLFIEVKLSKYIKNNWLIKGRAEYIVGIVSKSDSGRATLYLSDRPFKQVLRILTKLKNDGREVPRIHNETIDYASLGDDYAVLMQAADKQYDPSKIEQCLLAISKKDGGVYLLGIQLSAYSKTKAFKVLRFKTLEDAIKQTTWMRDHLEWEDDLTIEEQSIRRETFSVIRKLASGITNGNRKNDVENIRKAVIEGIPNNHYVSCDNTELLNSVAKQRKDTP